MSAPGAPPCSLPRLATRFTRPHLLFASPRVLLGDPVSTAFVQSPNHLASHLGPGADHATWFSTTRIANQ